jgi:hypothetical protein
VAIAGFGVIRTSKRASIALRPCEKNNESKAMTLLRELEELLMITSLLVLSQHVTYEHLGDHSNSAVASRYGTRHAV